MVHINIIGLFHSVAILWEIYVMRHKCHMRWHNFYLKRILITRLGQNILNIVKFLGTFFDQITQLTPFYTASKVEMLIIIYLLQREGRSISRQNLYETIETLTQFCHLPVFKKFTQQAWNYGVLVSSNIYSYF